MTHFLNPYLFICRISFITSFFLVISSCSKEEFTQTTTTTTETAVEVVVEEIMGCSTFSPPPLDILLIYDNSSSLKFFKRDIKASLRELVTSIFDNYKDYNICITPLIADAGSAYQNSCQFRISSNNVITSSPSVGVNDVDLDGAEVDFSQEKGISRTYNLIKNLRDPQSVNGILRNKSYTVAILISNGDDTERFRSGINIMNDELLNEYKKKFLDLTFLNKDVSNQTSLSQLRFISLVNYTKTSGCSSMTRDPGARYRALSSSIYSGQGLSDDTQDPYPDSYNLCQSKMEDIFKTIGDSINKLKIGHTYNLWPLGSMLGKDPNKLKVLRSSTRQLIPNDPIDGYTYDPSLAKKNIRSFPGIGVAPPEEYSGPFVVLNGSAELVYPDCLILKKEDYTKYYGYFVLPDEPKVDQMKIYINGKLIPKGGSDGWSYLGFQESTYLLVNSNLDDTPAPKPLENVDKYYRTGYVIKFSGQSVYTDGDKVGVYYKKAPLK